MGTEGKDLEWSCRSSQRWPEGSVQDPLETLSLSFQPITQGLSCNDQGCRGNYTQLCLCVTVSILASVCESCKCYQPDE